MDARVRYTKGVIRSTFVELLKKRPVNKITVKEICECSEINRATFYKYYDNPLHLMECMENELLDRLQERILALQHPRLTDIFRLILEDILANQEMYLILFSENGDKLFKDRLFRICYNDSIITVQRNFASFPTYQQEWIYYFIAEGCIGLLKQWIDNGMQQKPEEVIALAATLINAIHNQAILFAEPTKGSRAYEDT